MTPRRWFWVLVGVLAVWMVAATKLGGGKADEGLNQQAEGVGNLAKIFVVPFMRPLQWVQGQFARIVGGDRVTETQTEAALRHARELLDTQDAKLYYLQTQVQTLREELEARTHIHRQIGLTDDRIVLARVRGTTTGVSAETCTIDIGTSSGIARGAAVFSSSLAPVGRVASVSSNVAIVRLLTDPDRGMRVDARLVRDVPNGFMPIAQRCLVHGIGSGMLRSDSVDVTATTIPPAKGDKVLLADNDPRWQPLNGMPIGEVEEVSRLENQPLRYDLKIRPRVPVGPETMLWVVK